MTEFEAIARLTLALLAGAVIGWERETRQKPAGLRTHMLVSLGSATFLIVALRYQEISDEPGLDTFKVIGGIVGGVGFLGGGSIIQSRGSVSGLTTAATIWVASALGVAAAMGYYAVVATCVVLSLLTLAIGAVEKHIFGENPSQKDAPADNDS